jgi:hypothetical protein
VKAVKDVKEYYQLGECEIVFRLIALRHPADGYRTGFPEKAIVSDRTGMHGHSVVVVKDLCRCVDGPEKITRSKSEELPACDCFVFPWIHFVKLSYKCRN